MFLLLTVMTSHISDNRRKQADNRRLLLCSPGEGGGGTPVEVSAMIVGQIERFEVGFEVMRQLEEMRKLSAGFPGEPGLCEAGLDTAPQRETAAILLWGAVLLAGTLNAWD